MKKKITRNLKTGFLTLTMVCMTVMVEAQWTGLNPITTNSKVGIGTTSPDSKLEINSVPTATMSTSGPFGNTTCYSQETHLTLSGSSYAQDLEQLGSCPPGFFTPTFNGTYAWDITGTENAKLEFFLTKNLTGLGASYYTPLILTENKAIINTLHVQNLSSLNALEVSNTANFYSTASFYDNVNFEKRVDFNERTFFNQRSDFNENTFFNARSDFNERAYFYKDIELNNSNIILKGNNQNSSGTNEILLRSDGYIRAREVKVDLQTIPDYVFKKGYKLMPLRELESYIKINKHLPNIKGENEFNEDEGIGLGEMNLKLLEKVEELTLYTIQQQKEIDELRKMVFTLAKK